MSDPPGYVIYDGPSRLEGGTPIIAILTMRSENRKTGDMPQIWMLRKDRAPTTAALDGTDDAVCGECAFRLYLARNNPDRANCYVTLVHGPNAIWKAYHAGSYPTSWPDRIVDPVRVGSYGDPAAVPLKIWREFIAHCWGGYTMYTHQWRRFSGFRHYAMASVNSPAEQHLAAQRGWRTFRVIQKKEAAQHNHIGEITCPATPEAGRRTTCKQCRICDGKKGEHDRRKHITVSAH